MTKSSLLRIDARACGYGVAHEDKSEVWTTDLEGCLARLRSAIAGLDHMQADNYHLLMPPGFPSRHVRVNKLSDCYSISLGFTDCHGGYILGGLGCDLPETVEEVITRVRPLLELLRSTPDAVPINVPGIGIPWINRRS